MKPLYRVAAALAVAFMFWGATSLVAQYVGVGTLATLRLLPATFYQTVYLQGWRSANDGGQGTFVYNGSATCTDNAGTLIQAVGGCYQRQIVTAYNPQWFGAYCDDSHDDGTVLEAFIAAIPSGATVQLPGNLCHSTTTIDFHAPITVLCPSSGGFDFTGLADGQIGLNVRTSYFTFTGSKGCLVNGSRTPLTGSDFANVSRAFELLGVSGGRVTNERITGVTITNWKDTGIYADFVLESTFRDNTIQYVSYAGIVCQACNRVVMDSNYIYYVASSNGPGYTTSPTNTKTNAYGITISNEGAGDNSDTVLIINNIVDQVPTWHCYDTHSGINITFIGNVCTNAVYGIYLTEYNTLVPKNVKVIGNVITCIALNQPVYPGGPSISVGGAGIFASGITSSTLASNIAITNNTVNSCGSSESGSTLMGGITLSQIQNADVSHNIIAGGRYRGILTYNQILGTMTGNQLLTISAGPLASGTILIDIEGTNNELLLSNNWGNSSGSDGYKIAAQTGSFEVGIARSNTFYNLANLYNGSSASNRVDLGASAP